MERVAIIGGGEAGLTAQALARHGADLLLFEAGAPLGERRHDVAAHLGFGIGGAGLFSDGKFSFFPSGRHLYTLSDRSRRQDAYGAIERKLVLLAFHDGLSRTRSIGPRSTRRPWFPEEQFRNKDIAALMHPQLHRVLARSARILIEQFPDIATSDSMWLFPAIEGVGSFPTMDEGLRGVNERVRFCGDIVGRFRGPVPALVSDSNIGNAIAAVLGKQTTDISPTAWQ